MRFKNEVEQKAHDYLFSRIQSATREVEEHDSMNYALVDQELLDMMLERKKVNLQMYKFMMKKISK